jgi:histone-lysine N-methyltransferase SETD1
VEESEDDDDDEEEEVLPVHTQKQIDNAPHGAWLCMKCGNLNYRNRNACNTTTCSRPRGRTKAIDGSAAPMVHGQEQAQIEWEIKQQRKKKLEKGKGVPAAFPPPPNGMLPQGPNPGDLPGMLGAPNMRPNMRPGDWICPRPRCEELNFAKRIGCHKCDAGRYDKFPGMDGGSGGGAGGAGGGGGGGGGGGPAVPASTLIKMIVVETILPPNISADVIRKDFRDPRPAVITRNGSGKWCIEFESTDDRELAYQLHSGTIDGIRVQLVKPSVPTASQPTANRGHIGGGGGGGGGGPGDGLGPSSAVRPHLPAQIETDWMAVERNATRAIYDRLRESLKKHIARTVVNKLAVGIVNEWKNGVDNRPAPTPIPKKAEPTNRPNMKALTSLSITRKEGVLRPVPALLSRPAKRTEHAENAPSSTSRPPTTGPQKKKRRVNSETDTEDEPTERKARKRAGSAAQSNDDPDDFDVDFDADLELDVDDAEDPANSDDNEVAVVGSVSLKVGVNLLLEGGADASEDDDNDDDTDDDETQTPVPVVPYAQPAAVEQFTAAQLSAGAAMLADLDAEDLKHMLEIYSTRIQPFHPQLAWLPGTLKASLHRAAAAAAINSASPKPAAAAKKGRGGKLRVHTTGSARSEGYYHSAAKDFALEAKQRREKAREQHAAENPTEGPAEPAAAGAKKGLLKAKQASRTNRANQRRLQNAIASENFESDFLQFNQLKARKKQLRFDRSPIHGWGLFAMEPIRKNEMVIEYVGEIIRQPVADIREAAYENVGMKSSYLFRLDELYIVDATASGYLARFMNHSCGPNCTAQVIELGDRKKIVVYAQEDLAPGQEITYDYKFAREDGSLPCYCGDKSCRGTMN